VELDGEARREPQLVEAAHVLRVGDRDPERVAVGGEGDRDDAVEHRQRDHLDRRGVDARGGQVDERQVVLLGERPRRAERAHETLVDQRVREGVAGGPPLRVVRRLGRQQPALADRLRYGVGVTGCTVAAGLPTRVFRIFAAYEPQFRLVVEAHGRVH
jgi:hypothetical protein